MMHGENAKSNEVPSTERPKWLKKALNRFIVEFGDRVERHL